MRTRSGEWTNSVIKNPNSLDWSRRQDHARRGLGAVRRFTRLPISSATKALLTVYEALGIDPTQADPAGGSRRAHAPDQQK